MNYPRKAEGQTINMIVDDFKIMYYLFVGQNIFNKGWKGKQQELRFFNRWYREWENN